MMLMLLYWLLVTLLAISFSGSHPVWALVAGAVGGVALGAWGWLRVRRAPCEPGARNDGSRWMKWINRRELLLALPGVLVLAFPNRLPLWLPLGGLAWLVALGVCRWVLVGRPWGRTALVLPILLLVVLTSSLGLWASPDRAVTIQGVLRLLAGAGLFCFLVHSLDTPCRAQKAAWIFVAVGAVAACFGLLAIDPKDIGFPVARAVLQYLPGIGLHANPNYVGGTLTLILPMAVWGAVGQRSWGRLAYGVGLLIVGAGMALALARGALLATALALVITAAWSGRWMRRGVLLLAVVGGVLLYTTEASVLMDPAGGAAVERTWEGRKELWQRAVYISQDLPFTGIGIGSFPVVVDLLYPLFLIGPDARMPHAHNLYLQVAATTGFPGYVALWMLLAGWGGMIWDLLRCTAPGRDAARWRPTVLWLFGGGLAFLLYSVTDAIVPWEKAALGFWALLGLTASLWNLVGREGRIAVTDEEPPASGPGG